ncbi:MAG: M48 family metalloprotease [Acidobacteriia bacterium]|nr:M48 family metalloprotease [Terriglobia bacterium]
MFPPVERISRVWIRCVAPVLAFFVVLSVASAQQPPAAPAPPAFTFTKVDLELLEKSNELDRQMADRGLVYEDAQLTEYVSAVGNDVLPHGPDPENVKWRFHVLRDSIPNAFALPNGSIYVNTGLLALLENEAQLASVLAHEETHVLNRHGYIENRSYRKKALAANIFSGVAAAGDAAGGVGGLAAVLVGTVAPAILESTIYGYSRELEKEADLRAVGAINEADYSTEEMIITFKLLDSPHEVDLSQGFYQDHPKLKDRIAYVSEAVDGLHAHTPHPMVEEERYFAATEKVARDNVTMDIYAGRQRTAVAVAQRLVKKDPKSAANFRALGDAFRTLGARTPDPTPEELSSRGKKDARKSLVKLTPQEYEDSLMASPAGKAAWEANQKQSEDAYRKALEIDPAEAPAHRGLGFLYERERQWKPCAEEFQKYLELSPTAPDQAQIHRRLEAAQKQLAANASSPATP